MKIYQLQTAGEFYSRLEGNFSTEECMSMYAEHVGKKFAAKCVNEALGNKMEESNSLHDAIDRRYKSIVWGNMDKKD